MECACLLSSLPCHAFAAVLAVFDGSRWDRFRPAVADRWKEKPDPASGMFYDLGSHMLDQVGVCALRLEQGPFTSPAPLIAAVDECRCRARAHVSPFFNRRLLRPCPLPQVYQLFGVPEWVQADLLRQRPDTQVDDGFEVSTAKHTTLLRST